MKVILIFIIENQLLIKLKKNKRKKKFRYKKL
jgi:hypothetical protein